VTAFLSLTSDTLRRRDLTGHAMGRGAAEGTALNFFVCVILGRSCRIWGSAFPHIWGAVVGGANFVLLVDDDAAFADAAARSFESVGMRTLVALGSMPALDVFKGGD